MKKEREECLKKEREAAYALYLEREHATIERDNKLLFERVDNEARAIREEKEEEGQGEGKGTMLEPIEHLCMLSCIELFHVIL
jgi:hypothetical protein